MAVPPTLNLSETAAFTALRAFLVGALPTVVQVVRGEVNLVPEPGVPDFVVITPLRQARLATNTVATYDNVLTASIAGSVMTVATILHPAAPLATGTLLVDKVGVILANTTILNQLSGSTGGTGTYAVSGSQVLASGTLYAGVRTDLTPTEWTVQVDVHGPSSSDNLRAIEGLFRSEAGVNAVTALGYDVTPLYAEDAQQRPFINAEQQYEYRWSLDVYLQLNPIISTPQQFAEVLTPTTIEVDTTYPP